MIAVAIIAIMVMAGQEGPCPRKPAFENHRIF